MSYKKDYEFQVYSIDVANNKLKFEYSKTINYNDFTPLVIDDELELCNTPSAPTILEAVSYDYNGDRVSELVMKFRVSRICQTGTDSVPTQSLRFTGNDDSFSHNLSPSINASNTEYGYEEEIVRENIVPGQTFKINYNYVLLDLDQNIAASQSIYKLNTGSGGGNPLKFADFNGDGIMEIITQPNSQFGDVINIKRDLAFNYSQTNIGNFKQNFAGTEYRGMLLGDFNGDSKADILVPQTNKSYNWDL